MFIYDSIKGHLYPIYQKLLYFINSSTFLKLPKRKYT